MRHGRRWAVLFAVALSISVVAVGIWRSRWTGWGSSPQPPLVAVISAEDVLREIRAGKRVVFVDAREAAEFHEEHIPGAVNIPLREVSRLDRKLLGDPDLVIAYCLKDFRGFEVARALNEAGMRNSRILAQFGINGWKSQGLPTWRAGTSAGTAASALRACAQDPRSCLNSASPTGAPR